MQTGAILFLTFRDLWANKIILALFVFSTLAWLFLTFALNLDIVEGSIVGLRLFGLDTNVGETVQHPETGEVVQQDLALDRFVIEIESFVAGASYWIGTLLTLFATAPLLNGMLERGRVDLLLSKPIRRTPLLAGHILGVWLTMFLLAVYLLGMVWIVMSLKTGIWHTRFLLAIQLVVLMFMVMYGTVVLLTVSVQNTSVALISTYGLIFTSMFFIEHDALAQQIRLPWRNLYLSAYHVLPNFAEVTVTIAQLTGKDPVSSWYPLLSSVLFGVVVYAGAFLRFNARDF